MRFFKRTPKAVNHFWLPITMTTKFTSVSWDAIPPITPPLTESQKAAIVSRLSNLSLLVDVTLAGKVTVRVVP